MGSTLLWFSVAALTMSAVTEGSRAPSPKPPCVIAEEWAANYEGTLPHTLEELGAYPMLYRRAIYSKLSHGTRVRLWDAHFALYAGASSRLDKTQKRFIDSLRAQLPTLLSSRPKGKEDVLGARARQVLGFRAAKVIMTQLAEEDSLIIDGARAHSRADRVRSSFGHMRAQAALRTPAGFAVYLATNMVPERLLTAERRKALQTSSCTCSTHSDWCDFPQGPTAQMCSGIGRCLSQAGCGTLLLHECDGTCGTAGGQT